MLKILSALLLLLLCSVFTPLAQAKNKSDYLFLITINRATGQQELIYTDLYVLSGTATASSVIVGNRSVGSGDETCGRNMKIAVRGTDGLLVKQAKESSLRGIHEAWEIGWNDRVTVLSQKYQKLFTVTMQECPFPLIRMVPDKE